MANRERFITKYIIAVTGVCLILIVCLFGTINQYEKVIAIDEQTIETLRNDYAREYNRAETLLEDNIALTEYINNQAE